MGQVGGAKHLALTNSTMHTPIMLECGAMDGFVVDYGLLDQDIYLSLSELVLHS